MNGGCLNLLATLPEVVADKIRANSQKLHICPRSQDRRKAGFRSDLPQAFSARCDIDLGGDGHVTATVSGGHHASRTFSTYISFPKPSSQEGCYDPKIRK